MTDERLYDVVGREPLVDEALEAAIVAYRADNPVADDHLLRSAATRLRRLNDEARQLAGIVWLAPMYAAAFTRYSLEESP